MSSSNYEKIVKMTENANLPKLEWNPDCLPITMENLHERHAIPNSMEAFKHRPYSELAWFLFQCLESVPESTRNLERIRQFIDLHNLYAMTYRHSRLRYMQA